MNSEDKILFINKIIEDLIKLRDTYTSEENPREFLINHCIGFLVSLQIIERGGEISQEEEEHAKIGMRLFEEAPTKINIQFFNEVYEKLKKISKFIKRIKREK